MSSFQSNSISIFDNWLVNLEYSSHLIDDTKSIIQSDLLDTIETTEKIANKINFCETLTFILEYGTILTELKYIPSVVRINKFILLSFLIKA